MMQKITNISIPALMHYTTILYYQRHLTVFTGPQVVQNLYLYIITGPNALYRVNVSYTGEECINYSELDQVCEVKGMLCQFTYLPYVSTMLFDWRFVLAGVKDSVNAVCVFQPG